MNSFQFFKAQARLSRGSFWLHGLAVWVVFYLVSSMMGGSGVVGLTWLISGAALLALVLLCVRRLHDRSYSAWYLLLVFIPVVGALWLLWQCAFRRGLAQSNSWGDDPLQASGDYLVVR
jgi:uncharacterized membrane protein YhaH (DUF805 family)